MRSPTLSRFRKPRTSPVERATTLVKTSTLEDHGLDEIRVLSESKFLTLVRSMVEESVDKQLVERTPKEPKRSAKKSAAKKPARAAKQAVEQAENPPTPASPAIGQEVQAKWEALRSRHSQNIERIEGGMQRLSRAVDGIKEMIGTLSAQEAAAQSPRTPAPPPSPSVRQRAPQKKALLREMLL